jgi:hypothetical protein
MAVIATMALVGCASFHTPPGASVSVPYNEPVYGTSYSVNVTVATGWDDTGTGGWCDLPDVDNSFSCRFNLSNLDSIPMQPEGYKRLGIHLARRMCADALWSVGPLAEPLDSMDPETFMKTGGGLIGACSRALMLFRWMDHADVYDEVPGDS